MAANCERTFIAIKPDGVQRGLVGEIIKRFEQKGFRLVGMKFVHVSPWPLTCPSRYFSIYLYISLCGSSCIRTGSDAVFAESWPDRVTRQDTFSVSAIS